MFVGHVAAPFLCFYPLCKIYLKLCKNNKIILELILYNGYKCNCTVKLK